MVGTWIDVHATSYIVSHGSSVGKCSVRLSKVGRNECSRHDAISISRPSFSSPWSVWWGRHFKLDLDSMIWYPMVKARKAFTWKRLVVESTARPAPAPLRWKIKALPLHSPGNTDIPALETSSPSTLTVAQNNEQCDDIFIDKTKDIGSVIQLVRNYIRESFAHRVRWHEWLRAEYVPYKTPVHLVDHRTLLSFAWTIDTKLDLAAIGTNLHNDDLAAIGKHCFYPNQNCDYQNRTSEVSGPAGRA